MRLVCWLLSFIFDAWSAVTIAWPERHVHGFFRYAWYEFRARQGKIPYTKP